MSRHQKCFFFYSRPGYFCHKSTLWKGHSEPWPVEKRATQPQWTVTMRWLFEQSRAKQSTATIEISNVCCLWSTVSIRLAIRAKQLFACVLFATFCYYNCWKFCPTAYNNAVDDVDQTKKTKNTSFYSISILSLSLLFFCILFLPSNQ